MNLLNAAVMWWKAEREEKKCWSSAGFLSASPSGRQMTKKKITFFVCKRT